MGVTTIGSTGTYTTIASWETNESSAGAVGSIIDATTFEEHVVILGGGGTRTLTVASSVRHNFDKTGASLRPTDAGHSINVQETDFLVTYLRLGTGNANSDEGIRYTSGSGLGVGWCFFHDGNSTNSHDAIHMEPFDFVLDVYGCGFQNFSRAGVMWQMDNSATGSTMVSNITNCVAINCGASTEPGISTGGSNVGGGFGADDRNTSVKLNGCTCVCINCIAYTLSTNPIDNDFDDGSDNIPSSQTLSFAGSANNASVDGSAPGANSLTSITLANTLVAVTKGSEDIHLKSGSTASGLGTPSSGILTLDAEGRAFSTSWWDMGVEATPRAASIVSTGGADYTTIASWETNEAFRGAVGTINNGSTYAENIVLLGSNGDRTLTVGNTTDRHNFLSSQGASVAPSAAGHAFMLNEPRVTLEYIRITSTAAAASNEGIRLVDNTADGSQMKYLLIHDLVSTGDHDGIYFNCGDHDGSTFYVEGCVFQNIHRGGVHAQFGVVSSTISMNITNCSAINCGQDPVVGGNTPGGFGVDDLSTDDDYSTLTMTIKNSFAESDSTGLGANPGGDFQAGGLVGATSGVVDWGASDWNAGTDLTAPGSNSIFSLTPSNLFVGAGIGTEDAHLKNPSVLRGGGVALLAGTFDAEGDLFSTAAWDIGADADAVPASFPPQGFLRPITHLLVR